MNEMTAEEAAERLRLISKFSKNNMTKSDRKAIDFATALCRKLASGELREVGHVIESEARDAE